MTKTSPPQREGPPGSVRPSGFQGQIKGASLSDLVQMACLAGGRRVVRVASGNNVGHLYFRDAALVHAAARLQTGESAALEMLSWNDGTFEPVEREWPMRETISCTWQSLVIRAAQIRDESQMQRVDVLRDDVRPPTDFGGDPMAESMELSATPIQVAGHVLRSEDFEIALRLDSDGVILSNHGANQEFADVVAYACRLTELVGTQLGFERFVAMECALKKGRCFIVLEPGGEVVALKPRAQTDSHSLRELLGV